MGTRDCEWQDKDYVLSRFGKGALEGREKYYSYVKEGIGQGRRPELAGGGLIRSLGGWSRVLSLRRRGEKVTSDERILGSSEFAQSLLDDVNERERQTLRFGARVTDLALLGRQIARDEGITETELRSGSRRKNVSKARRLFCQLAVVKLGYPGAKVARFLGVSTSAVVRAASSEELPEIGSQL